jgi:hypothetical protein
MNGIGFVESLPNCTGCKLSVSGTINCTYPHLPGVEFPMNCESTVLCRGAGSCGITCPCTGQPVEPFGVICQQCP